MLSQPLFISHCHSVPGAVGEGSWREPYLGTTVTLDLDCVGVRQLVRPTVLRDSSSEAVAASASAMQQQQQQSGARAKPKITPSPTGAKINHDMPAGDSLSPPAYK